MTRQNLISISRVRAECLYTRRMQMKKTFDIVSSGENVADDAGEGHE